VTGGAGFIGSHIVDQCVDLGYQTIVIDNLSSGREENINPKAMFYQVDIMGKEIYDVLNKIGPDIVIHLAAQVDVQKSIVDPSNDAEINILGTVNLLKAIKQANVKKIIYASSAAIYGIPDYLPIDEEHFSNPISFYGISKYAPEHYIKTFAQMYHINYSILRYSNIYGIRQIEKGEGGVISIFIKKILSDEEIVVFGDGNQTRDFIYIEDVVEANIRAIFTKDNSILNVSTNTAISINDLISSLQQISNKKSIIKYAKPKIGDIMHSRLDNAKAINFLQWNPKHNLSEGLRKTYEFYYNSFLQERIIK
jgi:UDP-glucose 4-epimerase